MIRFFRIFLLFLSSAAALSCAKMADELAADNLEIGTVSISGGVFDRVSGQPVEDITIILSSYNVDDKSMKFPVASDTTYTDASGGYEVSLTTLSSFNFAITAADNAGNRPGGNYATEKIQMFISFSDSSFDEDSSIYYGQCTIYMKR